MQNTHFDKTDGSRLFTETLSTKVKTVFADETSLVSTETAGQNDQSEAANQKCFKFTIDVRPFRIFWDERTKRRRVSYWSLKAVDENSEENGSVVGLN